MRRGRKAADCRFAAFPSKSPMAPENAGGYSVPAPSASSSKPLLTKTVIASRASRACLPCACGVRVQALVAQAGARSEALAGLLAARLHEDGGTGAGAEHHQAHDGIARHCLAVAGDLDLGIEALGGTHEAGRRAGVKTL